MAPTLQEALAGLGKASPKKDEIVDYESTLPANAFDELMRMGNLRSGVTLHFQRIDTVAKSYIELLKPGQTMKDLPSEHWHDSFKRRANRRVSDGIPTEKRGGSPSGVKRLHGHLQALTITGAATREFIHPYEHRPLTARECARIQTFPDSYQWVGNSASVIQQIGNAVPPLAAKVIASHILSIDGQFGSGLQHVEQSTGARLLGYHLTEASAMSPALKATHKLLQSMHQGSFMFDGY